MYYLKVGWGTFIAGQTIRIVQLSGKHCYPTTRPSGPTLNVELSPINDRKVVAEITKIEVSGDEKTIEE